jgi:hypothetical protein
MFATYVIILLSMVLRAHSLLSGHLSECLCVFQRNLRGSFLEHLCPIIAAKIGEMHTMSCAACRT